MNPNDDLSTTMPDGWLTEAKRPRAPVPQEILDARARNQKRQKVWQWVGMAVGFPAIVGLFVLMNTSAGWDILGMVLGAVILVAGLALYFLPSIVANHRRHRNLMPILIVNLFLGWTLLGWVVALAWACFEEKR